MIQPLVRWMRVVVPEGVILSVAVAGVVIIDTLAWLSTLRGQIPDPEIPAGFRILLLTLCSVAFGAWRVIGFHPALNVDYRRWLELSPWKPGRPLPAGPLWLVPQDLVVIAILMALSHDTTILLLAIPIAMLAAYLVSMAAINRLIGLWPYAYLVAFGLFSIPLVHTQLEYVLAIEIACYVVTAWSIRRGLRTFPWKLPELLDGQSFKVAVEAMKERRLGWPYEVIQLTPPKLQIPYADGICLSLLAGWLELTLLIAIDPQARMLIIGGATQFACIAPVVVISRYLENHRSPISLGGRIFTLRWIIPAFDRVWMIPLIAGVLSAIGQFQLPIYWNCLSLTGFLLAVLVLGPHLERWRFTGQQRLCFGRNPTVTAAKDFIEI